MLVEFMEGRGWSIFNRVVKGDEAGEYTYTGGRENTGWWDLECREKKYEVRRRLRE